MDIGSGLGGLHDGAFRAPALLHLMGLLHPGNPRALLEDPVFCDYVLNAVAARLVRLAKLGPAQEGTAAEAVALSPAERQSLLDFIDQQLAYPISVADLTRRQGRPISDLSAVCKASFGKTPYALIQERRLEQAKSRLNSGELPLAQLALCCGFSSQAHFTTTFKQWMGITPGQFRRQMRNP